MTARATEGVASFNAFRARQSESHVEGGTEARRRSANCSLWWQRIELLFLS